MELRSVTSDLPLETFFTLTPSLNAIRQRYFQHCINRIYFHRNERVLLSLGTNLTSNTLQDLIDIRQKIMDFQKILNFMRVICLYYNWAAFSCGKIKFTMKTNRCIFLYKVFIFRTQKMDMIPYQLTRYSCNSPFDLDFDLKI